MSTPLDKLREAAQRAQDVNQHVAETAAKIVAEREQEPQQLPPPSQLEAKE